ncbi:Transposase domain [Mariniphaga anaerophila]|uniref:Transposase domain n=1 Tax=Mariniphaga anaerophila TaxID=1484053 RepID=A0A1M5FLD5_9BACT|nr:Transposase domain [Mariniphaga anaerophila]
MNKNTQPTLADSICDLRSRKIKSTFFHQINELLDWESLTAIINAHYTKGTSATGTPAYDGLLLFKVCLLQTWYGLSDYEVEDRINDSISFSYFCGMHIDQVSPDHSTISRFRTLMTKKKPMKNFSKKSIGN